MRRAPMRFHQLDRIHLRVNIGDQGQIYHLFNSLLQPEKRDIDLGKIKQVRTVLCDRYGKYPVGVA